MVVPVMDRYIVEPKTTERHQLSNKYVALLKKLFSLPVQRAAERSGAQNRQGRLFSLPLLSPSDHMLTLQ